MTAARSKIRTVSLLPTQFILIAVMLASGACSRKSNDAVRTSAAPRSGMISVPGGQFYLGQEKGGEPGHLVTVKAFETDRTEVTLASYGECVAAGKCEPGGSTWAACNWPGRSDKPQHPINCVTWEQANAYCAWNGKRLPTEVEWEFAARGMDGRMYPWGDAAPDSQTICSNKDRTGTCPAGSSPADKSPLGLLDMAGNVKEWTSTNEELPGGRKAYVMRGGGWHYDGLTPTMPVRVTERESLPPSETAADVGFRCAADVPGN